MTEETLARGSPPPTGTLGGSVGRGVSWSALNAMVLRLSQLAMNIVTVRIIAPEQFGVFAVALTAFAIIVNVSDLGVGSAIVREVDRTRAIAPTVFTVALGTSALLGGLMALGAPLIATTLGAAAAADAIRVLALTVLIGAAGAVPGALLTRDYLQKRRFAADAAAFVVSSAVLVVLAIAGHGVMALAWSRVAAQVSSTVLLFVLAPERYGPGFDRREAKALLRFSLPLAGANFLTFSIANLDFVVIGRLRGALQLGYYNLAYNVSGWPVSVFTAVLNNVTLTTLSRVRRSIAELERHLSAALATLAAAAFPVSALCIALATPLVTTVYGPRWAPAAPALAVLAAFGSMRVAIALLSDLLVALGMTRRLLALQGIWIAALVPAMVLGVHLGGIVGAGVAHVVVAGAVGVPAYLLAISRRTGLGLAWVGRSVRMPALAALAAGIVAWLVQRGVDGSVAACLLGGVTGSFVYAAVLWRWARRHVALLREMYGAAGARPAPAPTVVEDALTGVAGAAGRAVGGDRATR